MRQFTHYLLGLALLFLSESALAIHIEYWQTDKGAKVFFAETHEIPMVDVEIMFDAGSARDGKKFGLSLFTNLMLSEGTAHWTVDEISQQLENIGALLDTEIGRDLSSISLRSLSEEKYLDTVTNIAAEIIAHPSFPQDNFNRLQQTLLQSLEMEEEDPGTIANKAVLKAIYGKHPYGHPKQGEEKTISKMTVNDLKKFHQRYYLANNATLAIVGDLTLEQAKLFADKLISSLPQGKMPKKLPLATQTSFGTKQHIEFEASQNAIRIGKLGIAYGDPDYFPLIVGDYIFGSGSLTSRLFKQVRDIHGYTYGVYSTFVELKDKGPFLISLATRNEVTEQAIELTQSLLNEFLRNGVTEQELQDAKQYIIGSFDLLLSSNSQILQQIATIGFYGLPLDYLDTYRDHIAAVTREQVQQAFQKYVDPKRLVIITVGSTNAKTNG